MIPVGFFLDGIIIKDFGARPSIILEGIAQVITAFFYLVLFIKQKNKS